MEVIRKHKKELLLLLGVSSAAAVGYLVLKNRRKGSGELKNNDEPKQNGKSLSTALDKVAVKTEPKAQVEIQREAGYLTKSTLMNLLDVILDETKKQIEPLIKKNREERRKVFDSQEKWAILYQELIQDFNVISNEILERTCQQQGITLDEYMKSFQYYAMAGERQLVALHVSIFKELRGFVDQTKTLTKEQIIEAVLYESEAAKLEIQKLTSDPSAAAILMQAPEAVMGILQTRVKDMVFQRYGCEEEDIYGSLTENRLLGDPEVLAAFKQLDEASKVSIRRIK
eukprot:TRINITY_DN7440_c0_g1_i1.p1 TRINITY_DN7440_c0_g1~~TRINITY_DN7440_c0_g1_i1.p1  ORF type:complete len:285 (+),score=52.38 TRINITY_DN7440_c0_g1_i1:134-988(+)